MNQCSAVAASRQRTSPSRGGYGTLVIALSVTSLFAFSANRAGGQGTLADYQRARSLQDRTRNKVVGGRVEAHWIEGKPRFWYRAQIAPRRFRFVIVDASTGERADAFDHERLAQALKEATGRDTTAERLPLTSIEFSDDETSIEFNAHDKRWRYGFLDGDLDYIANPPRGTQGVKILDRPRRSRESGVETRVRFDNRTAEEVKLFWMDVAGRRSSYGSLAPKEKRDQRTYAGHVWLVTDAHNRPVVIFEATADAGRVQIDGSQRPQPAPPENGAAPRREGVSPDGNWQASIADHNVILRRCGEKEGVPLSDDGTEDDAYRPRFYWSPDSKKLVVMQRRRGEERNMHLIESSPDDQLQPKLHTVSYAKPGDRIPLERPRLFDVTRRTRVPVSEELFPQPWRISEVRWQPDSGRFTFLYNQRGHQVLRVVAVDAETGLASAVIDERSDTFIDYANKTFTHYLDESREIVWMSERDGWNHLYLYDAATGEVKNQITQGPWPVRGVDYVDEARRQIWFRAGGIYPQQDPYYVHYCRIDFDGSNLTVLTAGDGTHTVAYSPDRRFIIDTYSRVDLPPLTELRRSDDGRLICQLEAADASSLWDTGWRPPERFVAKARDGETDIYGVIYRPTTFDPDRMYPVIEKIYAGPHSAHVPKGFSAYRREQALAELGFIVVQIDGMGTSHRSKAFHDVCWKNLGDAGFPDRILWMQAAARQYPHMDLSRVGIYGGSAGGQNALRGLLVHGEFYKAGVADCGCHDNRMDKIWWNELWMGWPLGPHYEEQSNVTQAHHLKGKLLLIVGELDRNVDPASTMQVVDALIKTDKDFDMLVIPGAGHGAGGRPYGTRRQRDFFVRHLLGVEPRWQP